LPPETDSLPVWQGSWQLEGGQTLSQDETGLWLDQRHLAEEPIGTPSLSADNSRFVFTRRDPVPVAQGQLVACQAPAWQCSVIAHGDRAAISQDGEQIAWVDVETGLASVWIGSFDGEEQHQLTNVGIVSSGTGSPPPDFVPPPHQGPLSFDQDKLTWHSPDGPQSVVIP
ncbi:MAG: hypothetical protein ACI9VR_004251, partial [Cognaticolwellia sp.]